MQDMDKYTADTFQMPPVVQSVSITYRQASQQVRRRASNARMRASLRAMPCHGRAVPAVAALGKANNTQYVVAPVDKMRVPKRPSVC